jgi:hypothetical protein
MQQLVAMLTHYNSYQIRATVITIILTLLLLIISIFSKRMVTFVRAMAIGMILGCFVIYLDFSHQMNEAVTKHEYKAIKNQKTLEIKSNSDMIKDYKFEINSEDKEHIYIHRGTFFGEKSYVIDKSDLDEIND